MKNYDQSVKTTFLKIPQKNYSDRKLSDKEIIDRRWKVTEEALKQAYPKIRNIYRKIGDDALRIVKEIDFEYSKLNKNVPNKIKRYVNDQIEFWADSGLVQGYFEYLINTHTWTYKSVLYLLIYGAFLMGMERVKKVSEDVFVVTAVDSYAQANADRGRETFELLTMAVILGFAMMPVVQNTYVEYLDGLLLSQVDEMENFILVAQMQNIEISDDAIKIKMLKMAHRVLNVHDDKYSGGLDDATRVVSNDAYTYDAEDQKVRFIAEMDEKTTPMCKSLNGQVFNVTKENTFKRYSAQAGGVVEVSCKGLVKGVNMPPITDHFHWCRSTLTYQVDSLS